MKRLRWIAVLVLAVSFFTACATPPSPVIDRARSRGTLVVGTAASMPPLNMKAKDGRIMGYDVDLARLIARSMAVDLKLEAMSFSELLPALEAGRIDMIISGMTMTPERNLKVAFVGPYMVSGKSVLTKLSTLMKVDDLSKINAPAAKLAALKGSTSEAFIQQVLPKATLVTVNNYDEGFTLVMEDKVHAMVADHQTCLYYVVRYPDKDLTALITPFTYEPLGIAVPPNDPLLVNWLENLMKSLEGMGELNTLFNRWFKDGSWLKEMP
jgi:polar amino acid transport system substrate-binding protein